ncbi:divergent protein kinase domain 1C isoform X2 [Synchiropus splendidus]|uniref:divergent protein kinase domain 1C isoform X2 n=1 Tax=Synchiropus splendidus TaxID=270530 RepID=UPI00237EA08D|nr:divergent protein kinase domain 1C isoform X2 [Synchiropus splendidus]
MQPGGAPAWRARCSALLRWLSLRLCSRRGTLLFLLLWLGSWLLLNGLVLVRRNILSDFCTDDGSKKILEQLCADFGAGSVSGDMCLDLCVRRQVHYQQCLYYQSGKKVMAARWRGRPVVLKSKLENFSSYQPLALLDYQVRDAASGRLGPRANSSSPSLSAGRRRRPVAGGSHVLCHSGGSNPGTCPLVGGATQAVLLPQVRNSLGLGASLENPGNLSSLAQLWGAEPSNRERMYSRAELASLWSLLQQEEYTFLRVLQDLSVHVPRVLGSCGHFYAVEFLSAGRAWDQNLFSLEESGVSGQQGRWRIALSFLHMVSHFDLDFAHKLHLCDVKPENFAVRSDLTVVAIDVDMAFFEPKMSDILEQNCSTDDDCNFFDCSSRCDATTGHCSARRRNSNLQANSCLCVCVTRGRGRSLPLTLLRLPQVVCEKIFRPWFSPTLLGAKAGLPLQVELQRAVQECAKTEGGAAGDVHQRLLHVLTGLLKEGGASEEGGRGLG